VILEASCFETAAARPPQHEDWGSCLSFPFCHYRAVAPGERKRAVWRDETR